MTRYARTHRSAGYTLPEMLVVILIGASIAGLSFPEMSRMVRRGRLEEAAGRLESALRLSRQKALAHRTHYRLTLTPVLASTRSSSRTPPGRGFPTTIRSTRFPRESSSKATRTARRLRL